MDKLIIRRMTLEDIDQVMEIEHRCFSVPWTEEAFKMEIEKNRFARYLIGEVEGRIVAYGGMWMVIDEAHVTNIAVHPHDRGNGYGDAIVKAMIREAEKEGVLQMTLEVRSSNEVAQSLYRKHGFKSHGIRPKYYQDNQEDAVIMWRNDY